MAGSLPSVAPRIPPEQAIHDGYPGVPARTRLLALSEMRWAGLAMGLFLLGLAAQGLGSPSRFYWTAYLCCYLAGGWEPALAGLRALRDRNLDVDLLMVVASVGAAAIGQITDGALLIVIFATSGALEAVATARTEDSVRGLLHLAPERATQLDAGGGEQRVNAAELGLGAVILVRPGERIAADGVVVHGASEVDQASITGEPLPVERTVGDEVFAGTLNGSGALRIEVRRRAEDSVVARIAALVARASRTKARTQLFVERIEQRYSIGMVAVTVAVFVVPLALGQPLRDALLRAMTFMIVASPCAVVLATMPPLLAAIANAGRHGVLVKSAVVMEQLGATSLVAFDKTGTLTEGTPVLVDIHPIPAAGDDEAGDDEPGVDEPWGREEGLLRLAASVEHASEHPLAAAIVRAARERGLTWYGVTDFAARPGRGVHGRVAGRLVRVGSPAALGLEAVGPSALPWPQPVGSPAVPGIERMAPVAAVKIEQVRRAGNTAVVVAVERRVVGVLGLTDKVRAEAAGAVAALTRLTGAVPVLLTGDNADAAARVAGAVGITDIRAGLLPEDKLNAVRALADTGARVAVVGDGINDAPALASAHTGIAMGGIGADVTLRSADAVVVHDDLGTVASVIELSRRASRTVRANLLLAGVCIAGLVVWDLAGHLPLPLGVAGHEGSTVLVGLNGLRLLRHTRWSRLGVN